MYFSRKLELIKMLINLGVLTDEKCPEPEYWRWGVIKWLELPDSLKDEALKWGEVRWYGD